MVGKAARPVPIEVPRNRSQSQASAVLRSGVKDAEELAIRSQIQELQVKSKGLLSRQAGTLKMHMDL